jgi:trehalose/maltose hydrolase-like predicted phosphorylase
MVIAMRSKVRQTTPSNQSASTITTTVPREMGIVDQTTLFRLLGGLTGRIALLPYEFDRRSKIANFRYYEPRCDHGSSLSQATHALVAARLGDTELALSYFRSAASIDLAEDAARSSGGVHIATMGGLWQVAVFGFAGLSFLDDALALDPRLPAQWNSLGFRVQWRGRRLRVQIGREVNLLSATLEDGEPLKLIVAGEMHELLCGPPLRVAIRAVKSNVGV